MPLRNATLYENMTAEHIWGMVKNWPRECIPEEIQYLPASETLTGEGVFVFTRNSTHEGVYGHAVPVTVLVSMLCDYGARYAQVGLYQVKYPGKMGPDTIDFHAVLKTGAVVGCAGTPLHVVHIAVLWRKNS